jgi:hypothetical protein
MKTRLTIKAKTKAISGYGHDSDIKIAVDVGESIDEYVSAFRSALIVIGFSPETVSDAFGDEND